MAGVENCAFINLWGPHTYTYRAYLYTYVPHNVSVSGCALLYYVYLAILSQFNKQLARKVELSVVT